MRLFVTKEPCRDGSKIFYLWREGESYYKTEQIFKAYTIEEIDKYVLDNYVPFPKVAEKEYIF